MGKVVLQNQITQMKVTNVHRSTVLVHWAWSRDSHGELEVDSMNLKAPHAPPPPVYSVHQFWLVARTLDVLIIIMPYLWPKSVLQWLEVWPYNSIGTNALHCDDARINTTRKFEYKYVGPPYCRAEMYAGRVACCFLVSHGQYADGTDWQTDGHQNVTLCFSLDVARISWTVGRKPFNDDLQRVPAAGDCLLSHQVSHSVGGLSAQTYDYVTCLQTTSRRHAVLVHLYQHQQQHQQYQRYHQQRQSRFCSRCKPLWWSSESTRITRSVCLSVCSDFLS